MPVIGFKLKVGSESVQGVVKQLPRLVGLLEEGPGGEGGTLQETPFGQLAPPLGSARLKAVEVILLLHTRL